MKKTITLFIFLMVSVVNSQNPTIGLLHLKANVTEGYTLFSPETNNQVFLINNCGEKINEWTFNELPGLTCYLLENGNLLRAGKKALEIRDWDNNLIWSYDMQANGIKQHHDIAPLPNGNILLVVRDSYSDAEIIAQGKDPRNVSLNIDLDKIVEIKPIGTNAIEIVWEWKFIDHLIQDYDETKLNFGTVEEHPERIDINYIDPYFEERDRGFTHVNSIDYNPNLDQIIISARHLNEIYIIDHSTTTAEASGHSGGIANKGGDILWRWGNPMVYRQGGLEDQKLFLQHDAKWVPSGYTDEGKISVYNNGGDDIRTYSSVHLVDPGISGTTYTKENNRFTPLEYNWSWSGSILERTMFETKKSGTHSLPNGNFIICETSLGQVSEITKAGEHLWTYKNPSSDTIFNQFDQISNNFNSIFRAEKYPMDYIGFAGKDLMPKGIIENENSISATCSTLSIVQSEMNTLKILNPVSNNFLQFNKEIRLDYIKIRDVNGRAVLRTTNFFHDRLFINLTPGFYVLELGRGDVIKQAKIIIN